MTIVRLYHIFQLLTLFACMTIQATDKQTIIIAPKTIIPLATRNFTIKQPPNILSQKYFLNHTTIQAATDDGFSITGKFYHRNSKTLLIIGQGFLSPQEDLIDIVKNFNDYDILTFDYRWHNNDAFFSLIQHPYKNLLTACAQDVDTIINACLKQSRTNYTHIVGIGLCYSCYTFLKAHTQRPLFTHLILDSCWPTLDAFMENLIKDPWLSRNPQQGGTPSFFKQILTNPMIHFCLKKFCSLLLPGTESTLILLKEITIPVLFIYGKNDQLVNANNFYLLWKATQTRFKAAYINPSQHTNTAYLNPRLYKQICTLFFTSRTSTAFDAALRKLPQI